jgi:hypothetical protein
MFSNWFSGDDRERYRTSAHKQRIDFVGSSLLPLILLAPATAHGQQNQAVDLIPALKDECGIIKKMLQHQTVDSDANYKTAGALCGNLEAAAASSDAVGETRIIHDLYQLFARMNLPPATPADRLAALESAASRMDGLDRFHRLTDLAKVAFDAGYPDKAAGYAQELLRMAPQFPTNWNYGNAVYYGHFVLGRVALQAGDKAEAASQLLTAGKTRGSPQLNSFGPNLILAKQLIAEGGSQTVLEFLTDCKRFWKMDRGKLDEWISNIRAGKTPEFSNLNY